MSWVSDAWVVSLKEGTAPLVVAEKLAEMGYAHQPRWPGHRRSATRPRSPIAWPSRC
jgi:hypothetical protein